MYADRNLKRKASPTVHVRSPQSAKKVKEPQKVKVTFLDQLRRILSDVLVVKDVITIVIDYNKIQMSPYLAEFLRSGISPSLHKDPFWTDFLLPLPRLQVIFEEEFPEIFRQPKKTLPVAAVDKKFLFNNFDYLQKLAKGFGLKDQSQIQSIHLVTIIQGGGQVDIFLRYWVILIKEFQDAYQDKSLDYLARFVILALRSSEGVNRLLIRALTWTGIVGCKAMIEHCVDESELFIFLTQHFQWFPAGPSMESLFLEEHNTSWTNWLQALSLDSDARPRKILLPKIEKTVEKLKHYIVEPTLFITDFLKCANVPLKLYHILTLYYHSVVDAKKEVEDSVDEAIEYCAKKY